MRRITTNGLVAGAVIAVSAYSLLAWLAPRVALATILLSGIYVAFPLIAFGVVFADTRSYKGLYQPPLIVLTSALGLLAVGELYWAGHRVFAATAASSASLTDTFFVSAHLLLLVFTALLLRERWSQLPRAGRLKAALDSGMLVVIALVGVLWTFITALSTMIEAASADPGIGLYSAYALLDSLILVCVLAIMMTPGSTGLKGWESKIAVALGAFAAGDLAYSYLTKGGLFAREGASLAIDCAWMFGYVLLVVSVRVCVDSPEPRRAPLSTATVRTEEFVPLALATVLVPVFVILASRQGPNTLGYWVYTVASVVLAMLSVGRWAVSIADNRALVASSVTDGLTGCFNHRYFHERLGEETGRASRTEQTLSLALVDMDDFRLVNESLGHLAGDRRLALIGQALSHAVRTSDVVCRIGGDEFGIILPATSPAEAKNVLLRAMHLLSAKQERERLPVTVSVGIACIPVDADEKEALLLAADDALYRAKDEGRDRVVVNDTTTSSRSLGVDRLRRIEEQSLLRTVKALAATVDTRDAYTHSHSNEVALMAQAMGEQLGFCREHVSLLRIAALLHDVGKIGIPDEILTSTGRLTTDEFEHVWEHPDLSARILAAAVPARIVPWVRSHHERWDGRGYPDGLRGEDIPIEARIIAICDAYDAMVTERSYCQALSRDDAAREIQHCSGSQFDPRLAERFLKMLSERGELAYAV